MKQIRPAISNDRDAINDLLRVEFQSVPEFDLVDESAILWDGNCEDTVVLAAWDGGLCVATMRGDLADSQAQAAELLNVPLDWIPDTFPALILRRAATHADYRRLGLNTALRYQLLLGAPNAQSVLGVVYSGAPRTNLMRKLGYRFFPVPVDPDAAIKSLQTRQLAVLGRSELVSAIQMLSELAVAAMASFPSRAPEVALGGPAEPIYGQNSQERASYSADDF